MSEPFIDILMATYNGERFVGEQIDSIQRQTWKKWRLLVSDDCSVDGTLDVVRRYAAGDDRIRIISENVKHGGAKENFFALMGYSDAPYCMFCDQDDVWLPEKVEKTLNIVKRLEAESPDSPVLVFTDMKVVDGELNVVDGSFERFSAIDPARTAFPQVVAQSLGAGCTMMGNATVRDAALRIEKVDDVIMHDWWVSLIAAAFGSIGYLDEPTSMYRQHGMNEIGALEYSPVRRASHFDEMRESVAATLKQARVFRSCYGELMDRHQLKAIDEFLAAGNAKGVHAVLHLVRSGCWKKGLRKVGQIAVVVAGA